MSVLAAGSLMDALFFGPYGAKCDDATGLLPAFPVPVTYPQTAGLTLMPLQAPNYKAMVSLDKLAQLCILTLVLV